MLAALSTMVPISHVCILLVDDFEPWRQRIREILETRPEVRVVGEASDGLEALQKAEALKPDLILLDIGLPNLNGIEVGNRLRQTVPNANVLFLTQNNDAAVVRAALSHGAKGYAPLQRQAILNSLILLGCDFHALVLHTDC